MSKGKNDKDILKKIATALSGLSILLPRRLIINAGSYSVVRFGIPKEKIGLFITKLHRPYQISVIVGILLINILSWSNVKPKDIRYISIVTQWLYLIIHCIMLFIYWTSGTEGNLTAYYWVMIGAGLISGISNACVVSVNGKDITYFCACVPLSGILVPLYHFLFLKFTKGSNYETSYNIVFYQIIIHMTIIFVTSILWTYSFWDSKDGEGSSDSGSQSTSKLSEVISQMDLAVVGMALLLIIYPGIAPYQLISMEEGRKIDAYYMIISIFPSLAHSIMSAFKLEEVPDEKWTGKAKHWHYFWALVIIYLLLAIIFVYVLYNTDSTLSKHIIGNKRVVGCLTVMFLLLFEIISATGFNGVGPHGPFYNSLNTLIVLGTMTLLGFVGTGHLNKYRMYSGNAEKKWATEGYTNFQAFKFWFGGTMSNTWCNILTSFTTDVKGVLDESNWASVAESESEHESPDNTVVPSSAGLANTNLIDSFSVLRKDFLDLLPDDSTNSNTLSNQSVSPIVYIGNGYYKPSRIIKSCYPLSKNNLQRWYLMMKNPSDLNNVIDNEEVNSSLISNVYYPFSSSSDPLSSTEDLGCDFSIQFIHPSIRRYLFTANEPSYYYLFQESIGDSETSPLAKALLSAHKYQKKSKIHEVMAYMKSEENGPTSSIYDDSTWPLISEMAESNNHPQSMTMPYSDSFIGISMCPGGFLLPYHLGVLSLLSEHNIVNITTPLAGSSAGAIAAVSAGMGVNFYQMMNITENITENLRLNGIKHRLNQALHQILNAIIPSDSPEFLNNRIGSITCCCTLVTPILKAMYTSEYYDKQDLIQCVVASSNIPMYSGKSPTVKFRGANCIDGLFSSRKTLGSPPTGSKRDIVISSFHALKMRITTGLNDCVSPHLAGLDSLIERYLKLKSLQKRLQSIKYNLRGDFDEWKAFIQEAHMLCKRIINRCDKVDRESEIELQTHDLIVLTKHLTHGQIKLFKQVLQDAQTTIKFNMTRNVLMDFRKKIAGNPLTSDAIRHFVSKFGLIEWISTEIKRCNDIDLNLRISAPETKHSTQSPTPFAFEIKDPYGEDEDYDPYADQMECTDSQPFNTYGQNEHLNKIDTCKFERSAALISSLKRRLRKLKSIKKCISDFLWSVFPPNNLSYYYTNYNKLLSWKMSPSQIFNFALKGSSLENIRQMLDQGRADAFRWILLEYILLENYLYQQLEKCNKEINMFQNRLINLAGPNDLDLPSDTDISFSFTPKKGRCRGRNKDRTRKDKHKRPFGNSCNRVKNMKSDTIQHEHINYINNILGPPDEFDKVTPKRSDEETANTIVTPGITPTNKLLDEVGMDFEECKYSLDKAAANYLFKKQRKIIKRAIRLNILNNSDFMHVLTHTGHWINPNY